MGVKLVTKIYLFTRWQPDGLDVAVMASFQNGREVRVEADKQKIKEFVNNQVVPGLVTINGFMEWEYKFLAPLPLTQLQEKLL